MMGRHSGTLTLLRSDGTPIVDRCTVADTFPRRLRGLSGRPELAVGEGIVLRPSRGIYTSFLTAPIDVIFLDADQTVLQVVERLKPFRYAGCRGARDVVEVGAGTCRARGLAAGDAVVWAAVGARSDSTPVEDERPAREHRSGRVLIASGDRSYLRLSRFLLEHHDFVVEVVDRPEQVLELVRDEQAEIVLLDAEAGVTDVARVVAAIEAIHGPSSVVVVANESRRLPGLAIEERFAALERLVGPVPRALAEQLPEERSRAAAP